jgi:RNA polymerase sigma-70 factor (ECF subfamily)
MRDGTDGESPPGTFEEFYAAHFRALTVALYAYTGDLGDAQDLAQEAFCRALARWSKLMSYDDPVAWVRRVGWNLATSRWRRNRVANTFLRTQRERHIEGPSPDRVTLLQALATLPLAQRKIFAQHYLADMSVLDIARQEGIPEGTVKSVLHRARTALAGQLADLRKETRNV